MRFFAPLLLLLLLLPVFALQAAEHLAFPIGLQGGEGKTISGRISVDALDPNRKTAAVLIVSEQAPESFGDERHSISWSPISAAAKLPPAGNAYANYDQYLWRWIQMLAPDAVVTRNRSLSEALGSAVPCYRSLAEVPAQLAPSPLRQELQKRAKRSPIEIATALSKHYGRELKSVNYQSALAMVGRARLAQLKGKDSGKELAELAAIASRAPQAKSISGANIAGHLIFAELGMKERVAVAAESGRKHPGHNEMSDSVFMVCPMLAAAGRSGGDESFYQACVDHLERMQRLCLRQDGLYRHSPLDEAAWGRGNGFPALGLAWVLSEMPASFAGRKFVLEAFRNHIAALAKHQDASGMWHQVIDHPGSYREFTSTCMITYAILRGMREGWLDREKFTAIADRGWGAVKLRISLDGKSFTDACTGTGKQKSLQAYLERTAILGPDERSGGMALMVATERAYWEKQ